MFPGAYRDVVYRITTERTAPITLSAMNMPSGAALALYDACSSSATERSCFRNMGTAVTGYGGGTAALPAGTYYVVYEVPEAAVTQSSSITLNWGQYIAPSTWTYDVSTPTDAPFVDACVEAGAVSLFSNIDDAQQSVTPPFAVQVFDFSTTRTGNCSLTSNGFINVGPNRGMLLSGGLAGDTMLDGVIAPFALDLFTSTRGVCYVTRGEAPNRRFVVQWDHAQMYASMPPRMGDVLVQAVIHEAPTSTPNVIDFIYDRVDGFTRMPSVGLRGSYQDIVSPPTAVSAPSAVRFTPRRR